MVDGCPGVVGEDGNCPCCVKRAAFVEANEPTKPCEISGD